MSYTQQLRDENKRLREAVEGAATFAAAVGPLLTGDHRKACQDMQALMERVLRETSR